ncbi:MAG: acyloxyacyl hydrolase [Prevotellaceae bacterium]|jgi:hypothetical protein|nr:acyloxyacyl hydrolase [Prevotellaceae bacterium]
MKKTIIFNLFFFICSVTFSQTRHNYKFGTEYLYGTILKHNTHLENLVKKPVHGAKITVELQTMGEKPWHQYYHFPAVGLASAFLDLGNPDMLGYTFAVYPYINIPIIRTNYFIFNIKPGAGLSYVTQTFGDTNNGGNTDLNESNGAIGSHLNVYFSAGANIEISVGAGFSLIAEYNWNHISNGSILQPNSGINMLNGSVGVKYFPNYRNYQVPKKKEAENLPRKFTFEATVAGGVRELYYKDDKMYPIASLAFGIYRPFTNWYRMGLGLDAFYDGVYSYVNVPKKSGLYLRTYIDSDEFKNKIRAGISWQNELIIGRLTAGLHVGLYLYDPIKNLEPYAEAEKGKVNKPLIYSYNIEKEDGWLYTRVVGKYAVTEHFFASVALKTHLQKAEFIEWGLGCRF